MTEVTTRVGACDVFLDVETRDFKVIFLNGPTLTELDEKQAHWHLTENLGVPHADAIKALMDLDVERGRELGLTFLIYDFEADEPLSDPMPYAEAAKARETLQAAGEAPSGARLAPWGEDLDR
jgi:hypothetical protein